MSTTPTITTYTTTNSNDDKDDNDNDSFVIVVNNFVSEKKYLALETKYNRLRTKLIAIHKGQADERRKEFDFECDKIQENFEKCDLSISINLPPRECDLSEILGTIKRPRDDDEEEQRESNNHNNNKKYLKLQKEKDYVSIILMIS